MAWINDLDTVFTITTGDSRQYTPLWIPSSKALEWNIAEFEFPNQDGTLVRKLRPKGRRFPLQFVFAGENHLEVSQAFELSANDSRPWVIAHPYYGQIICHCPQLSVDNTEYNISRMTCTVIETLTDDRPRVSTDPIDKITADKERLDASLVDGFDVTPNASDVNLMASNNNRLYTEGARGIKGRLQAEEYFNAFNTANSAISTATTGPLQAIRTMQSVINAPALFTSSVKSRIDLLTNQFTKLRTTIVGITDRSKKKIYEQNGGALISAMALASANPQEGDFKNGTQVLEVITPIIDNYNAFIEDLDSVQSDNGGSPESFIPNANAIIALNSLINFTVSNLFIIALNARQERSFILDTDSNWIILTHKLYGPQDFDNKINELIENNQGGLFDMLQIRKGTRIIYYL